MKKISLLTPEDNYHYYSIFPSLFFVYVTGMTVMYPAAKKIILKGINLNR